MLLIAGEHETYVCMFVSGGLGEGDFWAFSGGKTLDSSLDRSNNFSGKVVFSQNCSVFNSSSNYRDFDYVCTFSLDMMNVFSVDNVCFLIE